MISIAHFLLLLTLGVGQVAIYIAVQSYKTSKSRYFFSYILVLGGFNAITLAHTIETFLKATLPDTYTLETGLERFDWIYILLSLIRIFIVFHMARFLWGLFLKPWPKKAAQLSWLLAGGFLVLQMVRYIWPHRASEVPQYSAMFIHFAFFTVLCILLIQSFRFARSVRNRSRKKALVSFMVFLLLFNCMLFFNRILGYSTWISLNTQMLIISILMLGYNFYHVFFFDRFLKDYMTEYPVRGMNHFDSLVQKLQITKREKEIVLLVCEGKANKEIAKILFISPVTVRDHLTNIFEKANVKSRLQLANLFRGNSD
jgi:DNA-binding CsgD family transcriptional regulator